MIDVLSSPAAIALLETLLHFVWQGVLVALSYLGWEAAFPRRSARQRYMALLTAFLALTLCPPVTLGLIWSNGAPATRLLAASEEAASVPIQSAAADGDTRSGAAGSVEVATAAEVFGAAREAEPAGVPALGTTRWLPQPIQPYLLLLWIVGVVFSGMRLIAGVAQVAWLRRGRTRISSELAERAGRIAARMGLQRLGLEVDWICASARIHEAAVVGFWRPVVLLPASWLTSLPMDVLEAVIAHELAHIRRHDVWVNLLQRIVEVLLFYHPAVWWLSNRLRLEREMCCDELAVESTGQRGGYVLALEQIGRLHSLRAVQLGASFTGNRKMKLLSRVRNILKTTDAPRHDSVGIVGLLAVVLSLFLLGLGGMAMSRPTVAAQDRGGEASAEAKEGTRRSAEAEAGPRRSAEGEAGPRRSAEGEAGPRRSAEGEAGPRRSAEGEAGPRRSAEGEAGPRRSAEGEAGPRRSAEGEAGPRRSAEGEAGPRRSEERERGGTRTAEGAGRDAVGEALRGFQPQTPREAALLQMIVQLQREVAELRRVVQAAGGNREPSRDGQSEFPGRGEGRYAAEDGERFALPAEWRGTKEGQVFRSYDKNGDDIVSLEEWLAMTNGNISPARRELQSKRFREAEPSGDGRFTPAEFIWWYRQGRQEAVERQRASGSRDGGPRTGPRDGEGSRTGPRDGEGTRTGPRDGEGSRTGPRDGEGSRTGPRDGEGGQPIRRDGDRR